MPGRDQKIETRGPVELWLLLISYGMYRSARRQRWEQLLINSLRTDDSLAVNFARVPAGGRPLFSGSDSGSTSVYQLLRNLPDLLLFICQK